MRFTKRTFIKTMFVIISVTVIFIALSQVKVYSLSESDVQNQVASSSKEAVAGNVFIWFLCAIAFLKIAKKIESILGSLGINVAHSGGSMLGELMVAMRGLSLLKRFGGGKGGAASNSGGVSGNGGSSGNNGGNPAGGFAGMVGRFNSNTPPTGSGNNMTAGGISLPQSQTASNQITGNSGSTASVLPTLHNDGEGSISGQLSAGDTNVNDSAISMAEYLTAANIPSDVSIPQNVPDIILFTDKKMKKY